MSEAKSTPGPWHFAGPVLRDHESVKRHSPLRSQFWEIGCPTDFSPPGVAAVNSEADAEFICRVVNSHDDLILAVRVLISAFGADHKEFTPQAYAIEKAKDALRKARGKADA